MAGSRTDTHSRTQRRLAAIHAAVRRIPAGRVASYGQVAEMAGLPGRARMVGWALRNAPDGLDLPWYRVLRADGRLAFPLDSDAWRRQRDLLADEGVLLQKGRVEARRYGPKEDLDQMFWGPLED